MVTDFTVRNKIQTFINIIKFVIAFASFNVY